MVTKKDFEVQRIQEKEGDNQGKYIQKGSKDVLCTIEDDLNSKQLEKTKEIEDQNDSHTKSVEAEKQFVEQTLSSTKKEKGIILFHLRSLYECFKNQCDY